MWGIVEEPARVLFHLNGYTKVILERTEGVGMADGGIVWDISTKKIPQHLRPIGSRFIVKYKHPDENIEGTVEEIREALHNTEIIELKNLIFRNEIITNRNI